MPGPGGGSRFRGSEIRGSCEAELLDKLFAAAPVRGESVGLPAAPVEGKHELPAESLAHRMLCNELFEFTDDVGMSGDSKVCVDARLETREAQLLELENLGLCEALVLKIRKSGAAPEAECFSQNAGRLVLEPRRALRRGTAPLGVSRAGQVRGEERNREAG